MSFPTRRQFAPLEQASLSSLAKTYTFSQVVLAGNLIVICYAGDKNTGSISVTDNVGTNGGANPWNIEVSAPGTSVSTYIAWKVAVGGETVVTATVQTAPSTGSTGYAEEMTDDGSGAWQVMAKASPAYNNTDRASAASGTTDTADHDARAIAVGTIDSMSNIGSEAQRTLPTFTNFTKIYDPEWPSGSGGGSAGCYVATANLAKNATTSTTFATNGGSDQLHCAIVAFGRVEAAATAPIVDAGADVVDWPVGTEFERIAVENDGGSPVTARGWEITAGPIDVGASNALQGFTYTPPQPGTYEFTYEATNAIGTDTDTMSLTAVSGGGGGGDIAVRARSAPAMRPDANSHTLPTPAGTVAGDQIFIWTSTDEVAATDGAIPSIGAASVADGWVTDPAWTAEQGTSTNVRGTLFRLPSAQGGGADELVINFPAGVSEPCAYIVIVVANGGTPVVGTISSVGGTTNTTHTPSAISGLDPSKDHLSLLFIAIDASSAQHDVTAPADWGNVEESEPPAAEANAVMAASMERTVVAGPTTITPGAITWTGGDQSIAIHVAIPEAEGPPPVDNDPIDIVPISRTAGYPHYAYDIARPGEDRELYPPSAIEGGLEFDPEFMGTSDGWLQAAVYENADTTSGSTNPRSEGRETQPGNDNNLGWNHLDGNTHWQRFRARVLEHPLVDNIGVSAGQIHSLDDDVMMVRTRYKNTWGNTRLILREYDPVEVNSVDLMELDSNYQFGTEFDLLFLVRNNRTYVFYNDFLIPVHNREGSRFPVTGTYMFKWGSYIQGASDWPTGELGIVQFRNVHHWHTSWAAPINYFNCPEVDPGAAVVGHPVGTPLVRTATENDPSGGGILQRKWSILSGPAGAGTPIGTSATLNWTPTTQGSYELMYGARNAEGGWSNPTFLSVTVGAPTGPEPGRMLLAVS